MPQIVGHVRHRTGVYEVASEPSIGTWLREGPDPDAPIVPKAILDSLRIGDDFTPVDAETWARWRDLAFSFISWDQRPNTPVDETSEVAVVLIRYGPGLSLWDSWAPEQEVHGGIVNSDLRPGHPMVCLRTGEVERGGLLGVLNRYREGDPVYPGPAAHGGSTHSHNVLGIGFSSRDDGSELGQPGLHAIIGRIRSHTPPGEAGGTPGEKTLTYEVGPSLVIGGKRFQHIATPEGVRKMDAEDVIRRADADRLYPYDPAAPRFHPNVLTCGLIRRYVERQLALPERSPVPRFGTSTPLHGMTGLALTTTPALGSVWAHYGTTSRYVAVQSLPPELQRVVAVMIEKGPSEVTFPRPLAAQEFQPAPGWESHTRRDKPGKKQHGLRKGEGALMMALVRNGRASTKDEAALLARIVEGTLCAEKSEVPDGAWWMLHDAIERSGFFIPNPEEEPLEEEEEEETAFSLMEE